MLPEVGRTGAEASPVEVAVVVVAEVDEAVVEAELEELVVLAVVVVVWADDVVELDFVMVVVVAPTCVPMWGVNAGKLSYKPWGSL